MKTIAETTAMLTNTRTEVVVEAEADNFREGEKFDAFLANSKIPMRWNGKVFVGNALGMEFTSPGPQVRYMKETR